jgi:hypothetical protein
MSLNKPHLEFTRVEMFSDLATPEGYPAGISQKLLASDLDETGGELLVSRTMVMRCLKRSTSIVFKFNYCCS